MQAICASEDPAFGLRADVARLVERLQVAERSLHGLQQSVGFQPESQWDAERFFDEIQTLVVRMHAVETVSEPLASRVHELEVSQTSDRGHTEAVARNAQNVEEALMESLLAEERARVSDSEKLAMCICATAEARSHISKLMWSAEEQGAALSNCLQTITALRSEIPQVTDERVGDDCRDTAETFANDVVSQPETDVVSLAKRVDVAERSVRALQQVLGSQSETYWDAERIFDEMQSLVVRLDALEASRLPIYRSRAQDDDDSALHSHVELLREEQQKLVREMQAQMRDENLMSEKVIRQEVSEWRESLNSEVQTSMVASLAYRSSSSGGAYMVRNDRLRMDRDVREDDDDSQSIASSTVATMFPKAPMPRRRDPTLSNGYNFFGNTLRGMLCTSDDTSIDAVIRDELVLGDESSVQL